MLVNFKINNKSIIDDTEEIRNINVTVKTSKYIKFGKESNDNNKEVNFEKEFVNFITIKCLGVF